MDKMTNYFLKSEKLVSFLKNIAQKGLKQAYLFSSTDKTKNYASCEILAMLACCQTKSACMTCSCCQKIFNNNSVDYFIYPRKDSILVEDIEEIISSCYILPLENEFKIYVLNDFDKANVASQNKFLKTLEEPPKNVIFLLNTTKTDMILSTIKSRCEKIILPSFSENDFLELLEKNNICVDETILECSGNNFGTYLNFLSADFSETFDYCLEIVSKMKQSSDVLTYSSKIAKDKANLENYFRALLIIFENMLLAKTSEDKIILKSKKKEILTLCTDFSERASVEILNDLILSNKQLNFNTNENLVIDCMLIDILKEKHEWN